MVLEQALMSRSISWGLKGGWMRGSRLRRNEVRDLWQLAIVRSSSRYLWANISSQLAVLTGYDRILTLRSSRPLALQIVRRYQTNKTYGVLGCLAPDREICKPGWKYGPLLWTVICLARGLLHGLHSLCSAAEYCVNRHNFVSPSIHRIFAEKTTSIEPHRENISFKDEPLVLAAW